MWCITVARHRGCHQVTYSVSLLSSWHLSVSLRDGSIEDRSVNSSKAGFLSLAKSWPTYIIKYLMWYGTDCLLLFSKACDPKINLFCSRYSNLRCVIIFINKKWIFHFFVLKPFLITAVEHWSQLTKIIWDRQLTRWVKNDEERFCHVFWWSTLSTKMIICGAVIISGYEVRVRN